MTKILKKTNNVSLLNIKKSLFFLIFGLSLTTYSQDIEKMDKKELRIALKNSNLNIDSLSIINITKDKEIALLKQNLISSYDTIKNQKTNITSLLLLKTKSDEKSKILEKEVSILRDSIEGLKKKIPLVISSFTLKMLPKNCCMVYSETKELYKAKKYICYWGKNENDTSLIIYLDNEKNVINRIDHDDETNDYQYKNDKYLVKIRKRKTIKEEDIVLLIESAELIIKNIRTGEELTKIIYGEGGC